MNLPAVNPKMSEIVASQIAALEQIAQAIRATDRLEDLTEARARIEAVRAWSKVHKEAKSMRLQLLIVEVEALVRIVELGGADTLSFGDQEAAEWLAAKTPEEREVVIRQSGNITTAAGMVRSIIRQEEADKAMKATRADGVHLATNPPLAEYDEQAVQDARANANALSAVIAEVAEDYMSTGMAFTVDELVDQIIHEAAIEPEVAEDRAFREGVSEVSRRFIRTTPPLSVEGIPIPRIITVRIDGKVHRIPVVNATLAHLDSDIADRQEQIRHDQAKAQKLIDVRGKLANMLSATDDADSIRIGTILARLVIAKEPTGTHGVIP
jgi:hypothetical protein